MGVSNQVPAHYIMLDGVLEHRPEAGTFPWAADVWTSEQTGHVGPRILGAEGILEDAGVSRYPQVGHRDRPEYVDEIRPRGQTLEEFARTLVAWTVRV